MSIGLARFPFLRDLDGFDFAAQALGRQEADPRDCDRALHRQCRGRSCWDVGKTHLSVAVGRQAILAGYTVLFVPAPRLVAQLAKAHSEGRLKERLMHLGKPKPLIIDELGYAVRV